MEHRMEWREKEGRETGRDVLFKGRQEIMYPRSGGNRLRENIVIARSICSSVNEV